MAKKKRKEKPISTKKKIYNAISGIISVLPFLIFILIINLIPSHWSGFVVLGGIGGLAVIVPILALFHFDWKHVKPHQYRTVKNLVMAIIICFLIMGISLATAYIPVLYNHINQDAAGFYAFGFLDILMFITFYFFARGAILDNLKQHFSNTELNRLTEGVKNQWWYDAVNKERSMGIVYIANKLFTIGFVIGTALHILLGWWAPVVMTSALLMCFTGFMLCILMFNAGLVYNFISAKTKKGKRKPPKVNSFIFIVFILLICVATVGVALEV